MSDGIRNRFARHPEQRSTKNQRFMAKTGHYGQARQEFNKAEETVMSVQ